MHDTGKKKTKEERQVKNIEMKEGLPMAKVLKKDRKTLTLIFRF